VLAFQTISGDPEQEYFADVTLERVHLESGLGHKLKLAKRPLLGAKRTCQADLSLTA
jgi:hypothetical protein